MSGVAKDDTNPTQPTDDTVPATGAPEAGDTEAQATPASPASEGEQRASRRNPPHLRVVTDGDSDFVPPAAPAIASAPHQRIGAIMRAARENSGFTLDQVSKETRVHLSHLRAIEDMTPNLLGAPVYAKGYIKAYARFLGMDEQTTLERYLSECAILKDPEKQEIAPPASSKSRKLPVAVPMLGILIVALVGAAAAFFLLNGDKQPVAASDDPAATAAAATGALAADPAASSQRLRIVALRPGMVEVRSAKGDKYVHREFVAGESYPVRVGAQWTVSVSDGASFEWRLGDQSLGLLKPEGGQVYSQSVDLAAQRAPVVTEVPVDPSIAAEAPPATTDVVTPPAAGANPAPPKPRPTTPRPQTQPPATGSTSPSVQAPAPAQPTTPAQDPALAAYPDQ